MYFQTKIGISKIYQNFLCYTFNDALFLTCNEMCQFLFINNENKVASDINLTHGVYQGQRKTFCPV